MRLQIYTQNYVPEVTAARYRVEALVNGFVARGHRVEVICPVPNHPTGIVHEGFRGRSLLRAKVGGARVSYVRVRVSPTKTARTRLEYYASYAAAAFTVGIGQRRPDAILATSPPLSVPAAAAAVAAARRVPWIFDVRDLWPKAALLMGEISEGSAYAAAERLELRLYRDADRVVTVTEPFRREIAGKTDPGKIALIPNGTTREWLLAGEREPQRSSLGFPDDRVVWTYAGNLGRSRRLDVAIQTARLLGDGFQLRIVGDGGERATLEQLAASAPPGSVAFTGLMEAEQAATQMRASDVLYVPQQRSLGDFVPSKLFDCCALGRPLVVAAVGETAALTTRAGIGLVTDPDSAEELATAVRRLADEPGLADELGGRGRAFALEHLRERQADLMVDLAEELVASGRG